MKQKILNLLFRGLSILGRFLLILYIGKYFSIELMGDYGIFFTTVMLSVLLLGYDFYVHTNRELLKVKEKEQGSLLLSQLIAHGVTYLVAFPLLYVLFYFDYIDANLIYLFYGLLILEHLGTEIFRALIVIQQSVLANILFFIRTSLWAFALIPYWHLNKIEDIGLDTIIQAWAIGGFCSNILGVTYLYLKYKDYKINIQRDWIKKGFTVGSKFLIGTIAYKTIEFADRYIVDYFLGREFVGIYTFYSQLSNILSTILFTLVITILYPQLIKAIYDKDKIQFKKIKSRMVKEVLSFSGIALVGAFFLLNPVLTLMGKSIFMLDKEVFYLLLFATILFNLSYVYHFILVGYHKDNQILYISVFVALFSIISNLICIHYYGLLGAGISKLIGFGMIYLLKYKFSTKIVDPNFN